MKINIIKQQGGVMVPVDDTECERMKRFNIVRHKIRPTLFTSMKSRVI